MMHKVQRRFHAILSKNNSVLRQDFKKLKIIEKVKCEKLAPTYRRDSVCFLLFLFVTIFWDNVNISIVGNCFLETPSIFTEIFRPVESCDICQEVKKIDTIYNISSEDFEWKYLRTLRPVVVKDSTKSWKAMEMFNFEFFKDLYSEIADDDDPTCQFFPYKTEFKTLAEALSMSPDRVRMKQGEKPWYIGWSNCFKRGGDILRSFYSKPYFLPNTSETINLSWIFMGTPGKGAPLHVDNVVYPSWQAQIKGKKEWTLVPPPECLFKCKSHTILVETGDIIVLDTNKWYHETNILPGEISITIGAEFD